MPAWLSGFQGYYGGLLSPNFQYGGFIAAPVFIAFICGLRRLQLNRQALLKLTALLLCVSLIAATFFSPFGLGLLKPYFKKPEYGQHEEALNVILSMVPGEASILTQNEIFPHVCHRVNAYVWPIFPKILKEPPPYAQGTEYVLLDLKKAGYSMVEYVLKLIRSRQYKIAAAADYIILLSKNHDGTLQENPYMTRGFRLQVYDKPEPEGQPLIDMPVASLEPAGKFISWKKGWCIKLSGTLHVEESGTYEFQLDSNQPASLTIDGVHTLNHTRGKLETLTVSLPAGKHGIQIVWRGEGGSAHLYLYWKKPGGNLPEPLPLNQITPEGEWNKWLSKPMVWNISRRDSVRTRPQP